MQQHPSSSSSSYVAQIGAALGHRRDFSLVEGASGGGGLSGWLHATQGSSPHRDHVLAALAAIGHLFVAVGDPTKSVREAAERALEHAFATEATFVAYLYAFSVAVPQELSVVLDEAFSNGGHSAAMFGLTAAVSAPPQPSSYSSQQQWSSAVAAAQLRAAISLKNFCTGRTFHREYGVADVVVDAHTGRTEQQTVVTGTTRMASDWRQNELIVPATRIAIREDLINALVARHVHPKIRRQLLGVVEHILEFELVSAAAAAKAARKAANKKNKKGSSGGGSGGGSVADPSTSSWSSLVPRLFQELEGHCGAIEAFSAHHNQQQQPSSAGGSSPLPPPEEHAALGQVMSQTQTLLAVLRLCCRRVSSIVDFPDEAESEGFFSTAVPLATRLMAAASTLFDLETHRAVASTAASPAAQQLLQGTGSNNNSNKTTIAAALFCIGDPSRRSLARLAVDPPAGAAGQTADDAAAAASECALLDVIGATDEQAAVICECHRLTHWALKCVWPTVSARLPRVLCNGDDNNHGGSGGFFGTFCDVLLHAWRQRAALLHGLASASPQAVLRTAPAVDQPLLGGLLTLRCLLASQGAHKDQHRVYFSSEGDASTGGNRIPAATFAEMAASSALMNALKWIAKFQHTLQLQLGHHDKRQIDVRERTVAALYRQQYAPAVVAEHVALLAFHHHPAEALALSPGLQASVVACAESGLVVVGAAAASAASPADGASALLHAAFARLLTSGAGIRTMDTLDAAIDAPACYHHFLRPLCQHGPLLTSYLFERLAHTDEDARLWAEDPEEYVRRQGAAVSTTPDAAHVSCRAVAMALVLRLLANSPPLPEEADALQQQQQNASSTSRSKQKKNQQNVPAAVRKDPTGAAAGLFAATVQYMMNVLQSRVSGGNALQTPEGDLQMDACLYAIGEMRATIAAHAEAGTCTSVDVSSASMEWLLIHCVLPETQCARAPFLRARAVLVLATYASSKKGGLQWSSPEQYQHILTSVLPLLHDPELPVRMQVAMSLGTLIQHPFAYPVVAPQMVPLIEAYFSAMREMTNDRVIRTLRKTIQCYRSTLSQWAVPLCDFLVQHFAGVYQTSLVKSGEEAAAMDGGSGGGYEDALADLSSGGGGGRSGGGRSQQQHQGPDLLDVLDAADELIFTITTLVRSLPSNAHPRRDPSLEEVYKGLQRSVLPMMDHLLKAANPAATAGGNSGQQGGEGATASFMSDLLAMFTALLQQSEVVIPEAWPVLLSGIEGLVLFGGVSDYISDMIVPLDNMISIDPAGLLTSSGRSWRSCCASNSNNNSSNTGTLPFHPPPSVEALPLVPCVDLLASIVRFVLVERPDMKPADAAAAPRIVECALLSAALAATGPDTCNTLTTEAFREPFMARAAAIAAAATNGNNNSVSSCCHHAVSSLLPPLVQCAVQRADHSPTFLFLLASVVLEGFIVSPAAALAVFSSSSSSVTVQQFFAQVGAMVVALAADGSAEDAQLQLRQLEVLGWLFGRLAAVIHDPSTVGLGGGEGEGSAAVAALQSVLVSLYALLPLVVHTAATQVGNMLEHAEKDAATAATLQTNTNNNGGGGNGCSDDEETDDDEDMNAFEDDDDDESDEDGGAGMAMGGMGGGGGMDTLRSLAQQAKAARKGMQDADMEGGEDVDSDDDDDGGDGDNYLEDFDATTPLDRINVWPTALAAAAHFQSDAAFTAAVQQACHAGQLALTTSQQQGIQQQQSAAMLHVSLGALEALAHQNARLQTLMAAAHFRAAAATSRKQ